MCKRRVVINLNLKQKHGIAYKVSVQVHLVIYDGWYLLFYYFRFSSTFFSEKSWGYKVHDPNEDNKNESSSETKLYEKNRLLKLGKFL